MAPNGIAAGVGTLFADAAGLAQVRLAGAADCEPEAGWADGGAAGAAAGTAAGAGLSSLRANLPASAIGGGARNLGAGGPGGEACRGGEGGTGLAEDARWTGAPSLRVRRVGGGAGGGPLREPVFCGLIVVLPGAGPGGGGGGALDFRSASICCSIFLCSMYILMNSAFSSIWSSVMPICSSSFSSGCQDGSVVSMAEVCLLDAAEFSVGDVTLNSLGGRID